MCSLTLELSGGAAVRLERDVSRPLPIVAFSEYGYLEIGLIKDRAE